MKTHASNKFYLTAYIDKDGAKKIPIVEIFRMVIPDEYRHLNPIIEEDPKDPFILVYLDYYNIKYEMIYNTETEYFYLEVDGKEKQISYYPILKYIDKVKRLIQYPEMGPKAAPQSAKPDKQAETFDFLVSEIKSNFKKNYNAKWN